MADNADHDCDNELIVDLRHRDAVVQMLADDLKVCPQRPDEDSEDLDLVLLKKLNIHDDYVARARKRYATEIAALETTARSFCPLDILLYDLRARFALDHGYVPVLGKNRDNAVIGYPQHKGVQDLNPERIDDPIEIPATGEGEGVRIGVVDTPLVEHDALPDDLVHGDTHGGSDPATPFAGHATFVAGLIRQAAPGADIDVRGPLSQDDGKSTTWEVAKQIVSFRKTDDPDSRIHILNLSLGCVTADNQPPLVFRRALGRLDEDILVVAAAGNRSWDHCRKPPKPYVSHIWPAAATSVVAVGARHDKKKNPHHDATFSMKREWVYAVAPGARVPSMYLTGKVEFTNGTTEVFTGWATWSGTSFAAARVSGEVAQYMTRYGVNAHDALQRLIDDPNSEVLRYAHKEGDKYDECKE